MVALISLFLVVSVSLVLTRIAAVALTHTGLSPDVARFQARSAFMGVGFTSSESEAIVRHPVRREIIYKLMLIGNAGIATAITALVLGFVDVSDAGDLFQRLGLLVSGLSLLLVVASNRTVNELLSRAVLWFLRRYTRLDLLDYTDLLHLSGGYRVTKVQVAEGSWLAGRQLKDLNLPARGLQVLGVSRASGEYLGAPGGPTSLDAGDVLILYGLDHAIKAIDWKSPP